MANQQHQSELEDALTKYNSKRIGEREAARQEIQQLGDDAVDKLLSAMKTEAVVRKKRQKQMLIGVLSIYGAMLAIMIIVSIHTGGKASSFSGMFGGISAITGSIYAATEKQKNGARALANYDDVRSVGILSEALNWQDKELIPIAAGALTRLLPRMQASDAPLLNHTQRAALLKHLSSRTARKRPELAVAIIRAMEQVGDEKAIAPVQELVDDSRVPVTVRAAARECLPGIRQRAEVARQANTLLRAAESPANESDTLLRPASAGQTEQSTLLHPVQIDDSTDRNDV